MLGFGTIGEFALGQVDRPAPWNERFQDAESWTERTRQAETWTERTRQAETWTEL